MAELHFRVRLAKSVAWEPKIREQTLVWETKSTLKQCLGVAQLGSPKSQHTLGEKELLPTPGLSQYYIKPFSGYLGKVFWEPNVEATRDFYRTSSLTDCHSLNSIQQPPKCAPGL